MIEKISKIYIVQNEYVHFIFIEQITVFCFIFENRIK